MKKKGIDNAVSTSTAPKEGGRLYRNPKPIKFLNPSGSKMTIFGMK